MTFYTIRHNKTGLYFNGTNFGAEDTISPSTKRFLTEPDRNTLKLIWPDSTVVAVSDPCNLAAAKFTVTLVSRKASLSRLVAGHLISAEAWFDFRPASTESLLNDSFIFNGKHLNDLLAYIGTLGADASNWSVTL